jgi:hypothetical protein
MSEGSGLGSTPGSNDDAGDTLYASGAERSGSLREDGEPVGAADHAADALDSGSDAEGDSVGDRGARSPYELLTGEDEPPASEDGEAVGDADRAADVERTS